MESPDLSVVIVADHYRTIRPVLVALCRQSVRDRLELVLVTTTAADLELDPGQLTGLGAVRIVEAGQITPMRAAREAGVRAATAPVVFLGETHSYAGPDFAARLIARHAEAWDVVVPGIDNANPENALSWASFLSDYGPWYRTLAAGEIGGGPTWNVSYKRAALLDLGASLGKALSAGDALAEDFRAKGRRWYFEPAAPLEHANVSRGRDWARERFLAGVVIAGNRNMRWSIPRRVAYLLATPLIALVLLARMRRPLRAIPAGTLPRGALTALVLGMFLRTAGEAVAYVRGMRARDEALMEEYELHKLKYTRHAR